VILGIDHIAIAVHDPDAAIAELAAFLGIPAGTSGGRHQAWGTRNRLLWLGDTYVELVTVFDANLARRSWLGGPTLQAIERGRPEAIAWAISTDDIDLDRFEMNAAGASLDPAVAGARRRPDGQVARWRLALPREIALAQPFLIEHEPTSAEWTDEDRALRAVAPGRVVAMEVPVDAIDGMSVTDEWQPIGGQWVRAARGSIATPVFRIGGLARGGPEAEVLGCRWHVE
jgi:hypothetical protein